VESFEVLERDGLARLGRFETPHGPVETPALLPVVHPDPARHPFPAHELEKGLGLRAVITSSYIAWRTPPLRETAERDGIHRLIGFGGTVMTDSGAFQQHAYGSVEVGPDEILEFQNRIGSDIATVLDRFTEPDTAHDEAAAALETTLERAQRARAMRPGLLAVPVQGGLFEDLRARSASEASGIADLLAVGGVVPLMERYRFADLSRALAAARPTLSPAAPVHLFGTGHPMVFAFAALFGVDLFDSAAYHKFARRGDLLFPEGTVPLDRLRERVCRCALCAAHPLLEVAGWPPAAREAHLARHNLAVSLEEIARVRQAIREGTLSELAERRAAAHPALRAGLREAYRHPEVFWGAEPESRRAFREIGPLSLERPAASAFRLARDRFLSGRTPGAIAPRLPIRPDALARWPLQSADGASLRWDVDTPFGPVPLELSDLYPVGPFLGEEEFSGGPRERGPPIERSDGRDGSDDWTALEIRSRLEWRYGRPAAAALEVGLRGERSRRTGRLRTLLSAEGPIFVIGTDGIPRPTFRGGARLLEAVGPGRERVVVAEDAVPFVREGRSLFSRFVGGADPALRPGSSALLVSPSDELLAVGRLVLAPYEMGRLRRGVAATVTAHARRPVPEPDDGEPEPGPGAVPREPEPLMGPARPRNAGAGGPFR
jgi:7-cyano-7-deazaguanine tRNA-ribosyltransferase